MAQHQFRRVLGAGLVMGVIALFAACGDDSGGDDDGDGVPGGQDASMQLSGATPGAGSAALEASKDGLGAGVVGQSAAPATGGGGSGGEPALPSVTDRKIIYSASMAVQTADVLGSFSEAQRIARTAGGFVDNSSLNYRKDEDGEERAYAMVRVRVPSEKYQDVLESLRKLDGGKARVVSEGSNSQEVTEQYTDLQSRLRNLQSTEARYLELLKEAKTINDILTVNDRINGVRAQIEQVQGRLNLLDDLSDFASVDVSLSPALPGKADPKPGDGGRASIGEVFESAWEASLVVARFLGYAGAVVAVAAIWLVVPGLLVLGGLYLYRRRAASAA